MTTVGRRRLMIGGIVVLNLVLVLFVFLDLHDGTPIHKNTVTALEQIALMNSFLFILWHGSEHSKRHKKIKTLP